MSPCKNALNVCATALVILIAVAAMMATFPPEQAGKFLAVAFVWATAGTFIKAIWA